MLAIPLGGCPGSDGDQPPAPDAGPSDDAAVDANVIDPVEPAPPAPPAPPALGPCPAGWVEQRDEDVATCEPWGRTGRSACEGASAQWPGTDGCQAIGSRCPDGELPEGLPDGADILWVRAGAADGGTGQPDAPFGTVGEALLAASSGTIVAIGKGTFDEPVRVGEGITLWGACASETILAASTTSTTAGVVTAGRSGVVVRNLRISGERIGIWATGSRADVQVVDVVVESALAVGLAVSDGARLVAERVAVRDTRVDDGQWGLGLHVAIGTAEVRHAVFERNHDVGVLSQGPDTSVLLEDVAVADTQPTGGNLGGQGLVAVDRAELTARRTVVEGSRKAGACPRFEGTMILEDVVVRDTIDDGARGWGGRAFYVDAAAHLSGARILVDGAGDAAVYANMPGTSVELEEIVVQDTRGSSPEGGFGSALVVQGGARVVVARSLFRRNRHVAVSVMEEGSFVHLEDLTVLDTDSQASDGRFGRALSLAYGCQVEVVRARLQRNRDAGIFADGEGTLLSLEDVSLADVDGAQSDGTSGFGLLLQSFAQAEVARLSVERSRYTAIAVIEGATLSAVDIDVRDTEGQRSDGLGGRGLSTQGGATVDLQRGRFVGNREIGVAAFDEGTVMSLQEVLIADTRARDCGGDCGDFGHGTGVGTYLGGSIELRRFGVLRSAQCGVQIAREGSLDLHEGEVGENPIGANVQVDGYDLDRLTDLVAWHDNERDFDSTELALPEPEIELQ